MKRNVAVVALGLALGYTLSRLGFTDYGQVRRMFTFADLRLFFTFVGAVTVTALGFVALRGGARLPHKPLHRGTLVGGVLFGVGWAVTGACPGAALAQLGEGQLAALLTLAGICAGTVAYRLAHARWFRWDRGSCDVD